jgi:proline iminopeptidase
VFDQRGCGRSRPYAALEHNTTADLIGDIEKLRTHLGIDQAVLFGGSWGATLALAYARACPERVLALVLRGVFACTRPELDWFYRDGANRLFPDAWRDFTARLKGDELDDVLGAYHARLCDGQSVDARRADALAWSRWESALISMTSDPHTVSPDPHRADALARIETHYFANGGFLEREGVLLEDVAHLKDIPGVIVQGRYDMVTPPRTAWALSQVWPAARLEIVPDAGHAAGEPGTVDGLVRATDHFARRFS